MEGKMFAPLEKMCWTEFKTSGHSLKNLGPPQKTPLPWCSKLVTSLAMSEVIIDGMRFDVSLCRS